MFIELVKKIFLVMGVVVASGCVSTDSSKNSGRACEGPAVVPMVGGVIEGASELRLVGSGVPRDDGTVITAVHVLRNLPVPAGGLCGRPYEIGGFFPAKEDEMSFISEDVGWIKTDCDFERTNILTSTMPSVGTRVVVSGFPVRSFQDHDTLSEYQDMPCQVLEGELIPAVGKWSLSDKNAMVMKINGVWGREIPGYSGGPCAYKNDDGEWVVFGILVRYFPDAQLSLFGQSTNIPIGKRYAIVVIAPIISITDEQGVSQRY